MKRSTYIGIILLSGLMIGYSCKKMEVYNGANSTLENIYTDLQGPLQSLTAIPIGFGIDYEWMRDNSTYRNTVAGEGSSVTFGYHMKHGAVVSDNGMLDFSRADELLAISKNAGLTVFGHTLAWHQNQNGRYLRTLVGDGGSQVNLLENGSFEEGSGDDFTSWEKWNGASNITATTVENERNQGSRGAKIVSTGGNPWDVQFVSPAVPTTVGSTYLLTFWIRAQSAGSTMRVSTSPNSLYSSDWAIGTEWQQISWEITANTDATQFAFDMGGSSTTFFLDDVQVINPDAPGGAEPAPLLANGSFESGDGDNFTSWNKLNGAASFTATTSKPNEVNHEDRAMKVAVAADGQHWQVQIASDPIQTTVGESYTVSLQIRAESPGGVMRMSTQPNALYQGDQNVPTTWSQISWTFEANTSATQIVLDMGLKANTYFVDDVRVTAGSPGGPSTGDEAAARVNDALKTFVQGMVNHFKADVQAWDVVNEPVNDNGTFRAGPFDASRDSSDVFYWGQYLGRDYVKNAFTYAHEADPTALLFINDYNLEASPVKLDSLIAMVDWLKASNVPIHGIGTQMHCGINTSYANIDAMFKKLAATGLQIRISELDVRLNPGNNRQGDVGHRKSLFTLQAQMYNYVISSYLRHIPPAQRHGITIWGVNDEESWIVVHQNGNDAPLLYDKDFNKKPAYGGIVKALKEAQ
ncbi:endo-1,4-beta-xylanase [Olivibacter sitiensis]|uniref:endo-1,4-beta-xylanase n=1 Tax=Olivibacter sitiensis TaxID=376470 RepID=UPI0004215E6D|nr:endo-1,4-beta-xylanase [Olivibacter sitiensis]